MRFGMCFLTRLAATAALGIAVATAAGADPLPAAPKQGPLNPGKSAGVQAAQQARTGLALVGAGAIIAVVIVAASTGGSNGGGQANSQSVPTTATTP
jgi:hypothetical protein